MGDLQHQIRRSVWEQHCLLTKNLAASAYASSIPTPDLEKAPPWSLECGGLMRLYAEALSICRLSTLVRQRRKFRAHFVLPSVQCTRKDVVQATKVKAWCRPVQ